VPGLDHGQERPGQAEGVLADHLRLQALEAEGDGIAAVGLGDARDAVRAHELEDRAQGVRRVQAVGAAQRRVGHRDRVDAEVGDARDRHTARTLRQKGTSAPAAAAESVLKPPCGTASPGARP
jgi:hypothetical protein